MKMFITPLEVRISDDIFFSYLRLNGVGLRDRLFDLAEWEWTDSSDNMDFFVNGVNGKGIGHETI